MAKQKLDWTTIDLDSSVTIAPLFELEKAAMAETDAEVRRLVAASRDVPEYQVRVGRSWGKLSFAIDPDAKAGDKMPVSL